MSYLSYLKQPKQKQKLNALLHIYELYKDIIYHYLSKPTGPSAKDLNIFYIRELVPTIFGLTKELKLDGMIKRKDIKLSPNYIPFTSLLVAEKELQDQGKDSEYVRKEVTYNYGKIKELVEDAAAVLQEPIPEIETVISKGRNLINLLEFTQTIQKDETIQENNDEEVKLSKTVTKKYKDMKLEFKNKKGKLQFNKSSKWIDLGGYNTRTFKMAKYILSPSSKSIQIDDIYEYIKIPKDNKNEELQKNTPRGRDLKRKIIEKVVDELQKEEFLKGHVSQPVFGKGGQTAIIEFI